VNDEGGFGLLYLGYHQEKHKSFKNLVSMLIHGHLTLKGLTQKRKQRWGKKIPIKKE